MAVCSNSIGASVNLLMNLSELDKYLELQLSTDDVKKGKPDPEIFTLAMQKFGVEPDQVLIIEDNENGVNAAKASGGHVLQITSPSDLNYEIIENKIKEIDTCKS